MKVSATVMDNKENMDAAGQVGEKVVPRSIGILKPKS